MLDSLKHFAQHCARTHYWISTSKGPSCVKRPLRLSHLEDHLAQGGKRIGLSPIAPGKDKTRIAVLDIDDHSGRAGWGMIDKALKKLVPQLLGCELQPHAFRSSGGKGAHIYLLWDELQDAYSVRELLKGILADAGYSPGTKGVAKGEIELFPKQDSVPEKGSGSMFVLPMAAESTPIDLSTYKLEDLEIAEDASYWRSSKAVPIREKPEVVVSEPPEDVSIEELSKVLGAIPNYGEDELDYDSWRNVIFAIHHASGGSAEGLVLAEEFSSRSSKCDVAFLRDRVWPYAKSDIENPITISTLRNVAREYEKPEDLIAMFDDLSDITPAVSETTEKLKYRVEPAAEFSQGKFPGWLIKGVLPQTELNVIYGISGAGKSFVALDMAAAIARGEKWRGRRVKQGRVVYICAEGVGGFRQRVMAYMQQNELRQMDLGILAATPNFLQKSDVRDTIKAIQAFGKVSLVVVDTLAQVMPGGNENSSEGMGMALNNCRGIHRATGATVTLIHHAGKDTSKGARGWSGLRAAADSEIEIVQCETQRQIRVRKMKDGRDGGVYPFNLQEVIIGVDPDGDSVESCTVEHLSDDDLETSMNKLKGDWEKATYSALLNMQGLEGDEVALAKLMDAICTRRNTELNYRVKGAINRAISNLEEKRYLVVSDEGLVRLIAWAQIPAEMSGEDRVHESYKHPDKKRRDFNWRNALLGVLDEWDGQFTCAEVVATAIKRRKRLGDVPTKTGPKYTEVVAEHMDALVESGECYVEDERVFKGKDKSVEELAEGLV